MQKLLAIKINLLMKGFQGVPIQVTFSKLGTFTVLNIQDGQLFTWGAGSKGQLARNCSDFQDSKPEPVHGLPNDLERFGRLWLVQRVVYHSIVIQYEMI